METKIVISKDKFEHETNCNDFFRKIGEPDKLMIFHKIVRANRGGFTFLSFIHYTKK